MKLADLQRWLNDNPPADMPFWPGARYTGRVGLRTSKEVLDLGGSPIHAGVDRAGGKKFLCPFDAIIEWKIVPGPAGSLLRIIPEELEEFEIQVFHTAAPKHTRDFEVRRRKGEEMPVVPGNIGMSTGVHTHTEVIMPYKNPDIYHFITDGCTTFVKDGRPYQHFIEHHARMYDLHEKEFLDKVKAQIKSWWITEASNRHVIRQSLPHYRVPSWAARKPTLHVDSRWLLQI